MRAKAISRGRSEWLGRDVTSVVLDQWGPFCDAGLANAVAEVFLEHERMSFSLARLDAGSPQWVASWTECLVEALAALRTEYTVLLRISAERVAIGAKATLAIATAEELERTSARSAAHAAAVSAAALAVAGGAAEYAEHDLVATPLKQIAESATDVTYDTLVSRYGALAPHTTSEQIALRESLRDLIRQSTGAAEAKDPRLANELHERTSRRLVDAETATGMTGENAFREYSELQVRRNEERFAATMAGLEAQLLQREAAGKKPRFYQRWT